MSFQRSYSHVLPENERERKTGREEESGKDRDKKEKEIKVQNSSSSLIPNFIILHLFRIFLPFAVLLKSGKDGDIKLLVKKLNIKLPVK